MHTHSGIYLRIHELAEKIASFGDVVFSLKARSPTPNLSEIKPLKRVDLNYTLNYEAISKARLKQLSQYVAAIITSQTTSTMNAIPIIPYNGRHEFAMISSEDKQWVAFKSPLKVACVFHDCVTTASTLRIYVINQVEVTNSEPLKEFLREIRALDNTAYGSNSWTFHSILTTWEDGTVAWGPTETLPEGTRCDDIDLTSFIPVSCGRLSPADFQKMVVNWRIDLDGKKEYVRVLIPTFESGFMTPMPSIRGYLHPQSCTKTQLMNTEHLQAVALDQESDDED